MYHILEETVPYLPVDKPTYLLSLIHILITLLPALCVFAFGQEYLEQGISASGIKG